MARGPNELEAKAKQMYIDGIKLVEIASQLSLPPGTVRRWKSEHKWDSERSESKANVRKKNKGGQPGNKNATGPPENKNAEKYGFFSKYLPEETFSIIQEIQHKDPLDILWENIQIAYAAIIRAQKLMYVKDQDDVTTTKIGEGYSETGSSEKWEVQQAWDKHANFLQAQARAMKTLESMINRYDEMLHKNWDKSSEEQRLRISKLRYEVSQLSGGSDGDTGIKDFLKAIKPTKEDMEALFVDEVIDDEENKEE